ncbi:MAG: hypothetical protein Q9160_006592 [Pyrenula sp. 1 TL-2023]
MTTFGPEIGSRRASQYTDASDEDDDEGVVMINPRQTRTASEPKDDMLQAKRMVQAFKARQSISKEVEVPSGSTAPESSTPPLEVYDDEQGYIPAEKGYRPGILSLLMGLVRQQPDPERAQTESRRSSISASGTSTPSRWYQRSPAHSLTSMANLLESSSMLASTAAANIRTRPERPMRPNRPGLPRSRSSGIVNTLQKITGRPLSSHRDAKITIKLDDIHERQKYIIKLCRALIENGAPTHRLEEMMKTTAKYLEISAQFLYLPGCMVISFDDHDTAQSTIRLVKVNQGIDLGKLEDVHDIYKKVNHGELGFKQAAESLENIKTAKPRYSPWLLVPMYGFASAFVGPFAFQARLIDLPISFVLGCLLGYLALILAPKTEVYSNVFEVVAAIVTSACARAIGSIRHEGTEIFCFSAIAQSSIALILPGYTILCGSLELQARNLVTGSVRIVYAIITSLLLGFGITIGTAFIGWLWKEATDSVTCPASSFPLWDSNPALTHFPFVPLFTLCLIIINQGKWKQAPAMLLIALIGFTVNYVVGKYLGSNLQVANAVGACAIGICAGLYSRLFQGVAAATILPAIFVQVPSGLAAGGSLVSGITSANQITGNGTGISVVNNGTTGFQAAQNASTVSATGPSSQLYGGTIFNVGYGMAQIAIGISVGLFVGTLFVYPFGKKGQRSVLFTF